MDVCDRFRLGTIVLCFYSNPHQFEVPTYLHLSVKSLKASVCHKLIRLHPLHIISVMSVFICGAVAVTAGQHSCQQFLIILSLWFLRQKCMRFNPDATVWVAKQRILCTLNQSLKDVLNYGLFQPASNGRDGKFLDEERILREYPQPISKGVPSLEVNCWPVRLLLPRVGIYIL